MTDAPEEQKGLSAGEFVLGGCSIVWIFAATLAGAFLLTIGTLACGAICDVIAIGWMVGGVLALLLVGFCIFLLISLVRSWFPKGLLVTTLAIDFGLLLLLGGFFAYLGGL